MEILPAWLIEEIEKLQRERSEAIRLQLNAIDDPIHSYPRKMPLRSKEDEEPIVISFQ